MVDYQRQSAFVASLRVDATRLTDAVKAILANRAEYTALGGQTFFNQFFLDAAADPSLNNAEPGITQDEFSDVIAALVSLESTGFNEFYKIKG